MVPVYRFPNHYKCFFQSLDQTIYPELPGIICTKSESAAGIKVQVCAEYLPRHCNPLLIEKTLESLKKVLDWEIVLERNNAYLDAAQKVNLERDKEKLLYALHNYIEYSNPLAKFVGGYHRLKVLCRIITITLIIIGACADVFLGGTMSVLVGALIGIIPELISLRISFINKNIKTGDPLRFAIKNLQSTFVAIEVQNDKPTSCAVQKKLQNAGSELARFITHFFSSQKDPKHLNENTGQPSLTTCKTLDGAVLTM